MKPATPYEVAAYRLRNAGYEQVGSGSAQLPESVKDMRWAMRPVEFWHNAEVGGFVALVRTGVNFDGVCAMLPCREEREFLRALTEGTR